MVDAIASTIEDGDSVYLVGFTHLIPVAGTRKSKRTATSQYPCDARPRARRLIADEFVGTSSPGAGNSGVGSLHAFRRAAEDRVPNRIG